MRIFFLKFSFGPSKPKAVYLGHTQVSNQLGIIFLRQSIELFLDISIDNVDVNWDNFWGRAHV